MTNANTLTLVSVVVGLLPSTMLVQSDPKGSDLAFDRSECEHSSLEDVRTQDDTSQDWLRRFEVWCYGAVDYVHTGAGGSRPRGVRGLVGVAAVLSS